MIRKLLAAAILLAGGLSARADITSNLEAYYNCNDGSGSYYVDSVAGNSLFIVSSGWTSPGKVGSNCANFATTQYASTATWAGIQGTGAFSTAFWVKTSTGGNQSILSFGHASNLGEAYRVRLESGVLWIRCTGATANVTAATALNDGAWHHVVITQPASATMNQVKFYVDGVNQALAFTGPTQALNRGTTVNLYLSFDFSDSVYFVGQKDDVRLYNRELSASDVLELFVLGSATINDPVAWWKLDETSGTSAADSSGNGYSGTYARDASNTTTAGVAGTAYDADGSNDKIALPTGIISGATAITIACHFRPTLDATANRGVFGFGQEGNRQMWLYYQPDGSFAVHGSTSGTNDIVLAPGPGTLANASDYHICVTWDGSLAKLYLNRAVISTDTSLGAAIKAGDTISQIGRIGTYERAKGRIDDVRIYNRALDAREVYALYRYTDAAIIHSRGRAVNSGAIVQKQTKATIVNR